MVKRLLKKRSRKVWQDINSPSTSHPTGRRTVLLMRQKQPKGLMYQKQAKWDELGGIPLQFQTKDNKSVLQVGQVMIIFWRSAVWRPKAVLC